MRSVAIYVGPDFVGDRWQHFRLQLRLNVVNLEYLTIYICVWTPVMLKPRCQKFGYLLEFLASALSTWPRLTSLAGNLWVFLRFISQLV